MHSSTEDVLDATVGIPSYVLSRAAFRTIPGASVQTPDPVELTYHVRVKSEQDPTVTVFLFKGDPDEVAANLQKLRPKTRTTR